MKPSLQLRLSQHLALTPQLQQSIRLLQLSTLELNQELEQILSENPLLERLDDPLQSCVSIAPNGGLDSAAGPAPAADPRQADGEPPAGQDTPGGSEAAEGSSSDNWDDGSGDSSADWGGDAGPRTRNDDDNDERDWPQLAAVETNLSEHLASQLAATRVSARDRALVNLLIGELNDDGLLDASLEEIAASLPAELEIEPEELSAALRLLQSFEPTGVGARDLRECLLLQIDAGAGGHCPPAVRKAAREIVSSHLEALAARDYPRLKRALRCDEPTLRDAQALIRQLNPRPAANYTAEAPAYVVPDVIVRRTRGGWTAALNPDVMPKLRINEMYADILRRNRGSHSELSGRLQEARWLVKNVQQRFDTILRVSQAIVNRQRAFFSHGEVAMRPLVLREIADTLGLHESTVSRVTTQKYMLTPLGTFELKYFFGSHVATDSGGAASSTAIRALIKQLVAAEDPTRPLSDNRIADLLGEQGFVVARRTVAKYREALRIPAVAQRRAL
ncbi:RNA polymerase factor sigma-54 [Burkholderiaceae bacterium FT117]|uniref:RNA polymerase factor sigma-54 n=1 Tax=Zeimonas sediminis TaxID=2944268 RepID=UPI002342E322|nr:RNA polymerase factor sigma-54 [Zeimonas sediminis]MCM5571797.1 RNA polymerase factor sigma-54 [Zeimonas sediminis]